MDKEDVVCIYDEILFNHKKNEIMPFAAIQMDLEIIILSEVSQTKTTIYRVGSQAGGPSMCLMRQTTEKDPTQGSPVSAYMGRATTDKDWPNRPSDHQLQKAQKNR